MHNSDPFCVEALFKRVFAVSCFLKPLRTLEYFFLPQIANRLCFCAFKGEPCLRDKRLFVYVRLEISWSTEHTD